MEQLMDIPADHRLLDRAQPERLATQSDASGRVDTIFVLNSLALGGSERKIVRLAERLRARGATPGVACLNGPYTLADSVGSEVPLWRLERKGKFSVGAVNRLRRIVRDARPRTLIAVNLYPALYVLAAAALAPAPRPRVVCLINTSINGVRGGGWRASLYRLLLPLFDRTVHGCETQRTMWLARDSAAWRRSQVIYNGIDLEEFRYEALRVPIAQLRAQLGIPPGRFVIGSIGRLAPEKNHAVLISALARLKAAGVDAHLFIAGEGPMRAELQQQAERQGVRSRVSLPGAVQDVRPVLAAMDVFVLPSTDVESFSNAALEAMAMARPVILSNIGGAGEMVRNGVDGYILSVDELEARLPPLLAALCAAPMRRAQLGLAARERVEKEFSIEAMTDRYRSLSVAPAGEEHTCATKPT
jgi:glycosyltransferase involved in cell wall biosynthesis